MSFIFIENEEKSFKNFYLSAMKRGSYISKITSEKDVVLISKRTSFDQIEAFIGCILYNRIPVIIPHPSKKVPRHEFMDKMNKIDQAVHPKLCISDEQEKDLFSAKWRTICDTLPVDKLEPLPEIKDNKETAFIQLSSGTTGLPKVMEMSHYALIEHCDEYAARLGMSDKDVVVSWLPLYHDMGLIACFLTPLLMNISFVHINPFKWLSNPELLFENIEKYNGTHTWMPNFAFSLMAKRCKNSTINLSSMKRWISCSEVVHKKDMMSFFRAFKKNGVQENSMQVCYALAENVFAVSQSDGLHTSKYNGSEIVSCGELIPGTSVLIKQGNSIITSSEKAGHVCIKSSYMAKNLKKSLHGYYETGDVGFIKDNNLYIMGRLDDMIISYGKNIFPYEFEQYVSGIKGIITGRVACFGAYKEKLGTQEVFIVAESMESDLERLSSLVFSKICSQFDINVKCFLRKRGYIIKTSSGKINRKKTCQKLLGELKNA